MKIRPRTIGWGLLAGILAALFIGATPAIGVAGEVPSALPTCLPPSESASPSASASPYESPSSTESPSESPSPSSTATDSPEPTPSVVPTTTEPVPPSPTQAVSPTVFVPSPTALAGGVGGIGSGPGQLAVTGRNTVVWAVTGVSLIVLGLVLAGLSFVRRRRGQVA